MKVLKTDDTRKSVNPASHTHFPHKKTQKPLSSSLTFFQFFQAFSPNITTQSCRIINSITHPCFLPPNKSIFALPHHKHRHIGRTYKSISSYNTPSTSTTAFLRLSFIVAGIVLSSTFEIWLSCNTTNPSRV